MIEIETLIPIMIKSYLVKIYQSSREMSSGSSTQTQPRRRRVVKDGLRCIADMQKGHRVVCLEPPPPLRVLEYERTFAIG